MLRHEQTQLNQVCYFPFFDALLANIRSVSRAYLKHSLKIVGRDDKNALNDYVQNAVHIEKE